MNNLELLLRFVIGGGVIAGTTLIAERFNPTLGGILSTVPSATIVSLIIVGRAAGEGSAVNFAKGMVFGTAPWMGYIMAVIFLTERIGLTRSLALGLVIWIVLVPVIFRFSA